MISSTTQSLFIVYSGIILHKNVLFPHVRSFALICCPIILPNSSHIVQLFMDLFPYSKTRSTIGKTPSLWKLSLLFILSQWSTDIRATALLKSLNFEFLFFRDASLMFYLNDMMEVISTPERS